MGRSKRNRLIEIAYNKATIPFHGYVNGNESNLDPIIRLFPKWNIKDADSSWCASFVYYCLIEAGFDIPYSPKGCKSCSLAGCGGFEEFAIYDKEIEYHKRNDEFDVEAGDIVIYDNVFLNEENDHMGIIIEVNNDFLIVAEGNIPGENTSGIVKRRMDEHIRCYIRIPDDYKYVG